jgi:beta-N-acetylhexosaminidase
VNVDEFLAQLTLEEKIGQLLMQYVYGCAADAPDPRNTQRYGVATPAEVVAKYRLGGVIYFNWANNIGRPGQIAEFSSGLQAGVPALADPGDDMPARIPLLIGTDAETGQANQIGPPATQFPGAMALAATQDPANTRTAYAITGTELRAMGINACFAPVADTNLNPANPVIGVRSFSSDPAVVCDHVTAAVDGLQSDAGISAASKHFPGHGDTTTDSHSGLPVITHVPLDWELLDAPPFRAAIAAGCDMIMTGHLSFPALDPTGAPATLSEQMLSGLLREKLGYDGVIITDSLRMRGIRQGCDDGEVAVRALSAGADLLLEPAEPDTAVEAIRAATESGRLALSQIDASVRRILTMKSDRVVFDTPSAGSAAVVDTVGSIDHHTWADRIAAATITVLTDDENLVPLWRRPTAVVGSNGDVVNALAKELADAGIQTRTETISPGQAGRYRASRAAQETGQTIVVLDDACRDPAGSDGQAGLLRAVQSATRRVMVIAVTSPYDAELASGPGSWLLTYSKAPIAIRALAHVLLGQQSATGRLPVSIRGGTSDQRQFDYGAGLRRR